VFLTNRSYSPRRPKQSFTELKLVRAKVSDAARAAVGTCS